LNFSSDGEGELLLDKKYPRPSVRVLGKAIPLPKWRFGRLLLGCCFVIGGIFGFLPIVGYWMFPVGLLILSYDSPRIRRFRRRCDVWLMRRCTLCRSFKNRAKNKEKEKKKTVSTPLS